jgi:hypothetical protein
MSSYVYDINLIVDLIQTIASIAVILDSIEIIIERHQYSSRGVFNFEVLGTYKKWMLSKKVKPILDTLFKYPNFIFLVSIQLVSAILILSHLFVNFSILFVTVILVIHLLSHVRNHYGMNGSDQLQVIIFISLFVYYIFPFDPIVQKFSIFFLCFQSLLSYFMAGLAKLVSPMWRNGIAIAGIMNTEIFGNKIFAQILIKNSLVSKIICWWVIIFECIFPLLIFTGIQSAVIFTIIGTVFHLSLAVFMRFNSFFWSFVATYPALLFFATEFQSLIQSFSFYH